MKTICIDIGNTDICAGVYDDSKLIDHTRCPSDTRSSAFFDGGPDFVYDRAIISSVVPNVTKCWTDEISERYGIETVLCSAKTAGDLFVCNVDNRDSIGADRVADAVAARQIYGNNCIVVDFGTATNIEYIDHNGIFQGGIFAPGLWSGMKGLEHAAAKLPDVRIELPSNLIGKNTIDAIQSGVVFGEACRVDGLVAKIIEQVSPDDPPKVIATGGFSPLMTKICKCFTIFDNLLTIKGLWIIIDSQ